MGNTLEEINKKLEQYEELKIDQRLEDIEKKLAKIEAEIKIRKAILYGEKKV